MTQYKAVEISNRLVLVSSVAKSNVKLVVVMVVVLVMAGNLTRMVVMMVGLA